MIEREYPRVADLADAWGVPRRTLQNRFREAVGMSPGRYLRQYRMQLARKALTNPEPSDTVTAIATRYGFTELGRFAIAYRRMFGEKPSATLRRAR